MESIREYLENLFVNMPATDEVIRAKKELLQMMEDKYEELIANGRAENEAAGIVISEFGNFEELARELGIEGYLRGNADNSSQPPAAAQQKKAKEKETTAKKMLHWTKENVKNYIDYAWKHAKYVALGVALCIFAPFSDELIESLGDACMIPEIISDGLGTAGLFGCIAIAIVLFLKAGNMKKAATSLKHATVSISKDGADCLQEEMSQDENSCVKWRTIGIVLCIVSVVPSSFSQIFASYPPLENILDASVLPIVSVGVFLIVYACSAWNRYKELKKAMQKTPESETYTEEYSHIVPESKHSGKKTIGIVIAVAAILTAAIISVSSFLAIQGTFHNVSTIAVNKTYSGNMVKEIRLDTNFSKVTIEEAKDEQISIDGVLVGNPDISLNQDTGVLAIAESSKKNRIGIFSFFSWKMNAGNITLRIPNSASLKKCIVNCDAGDVRINRVKADTFDIEVDAGNFESDGIMAEKVTAEVDAGNIQMTNAFVMHFEADVDAGNCEFQSADDIDIDEYNIDTEVDLGENRFAGEKVSNHYTKKERSDKWVKATVNLGNISIR